MTWTLKITRTLSNGQPITGVHLLDASSLTDALRSAAPLINSAPKFSINNF